jgi:hypothetical protein
MGERWGCSGKNRCSPYLFAPQQDIAIQLLGKNRWVSKSLCFQLFSSGHSKPLSTTPHWLF